MYPFIRLGTSIAKSMLSNRQGKTLAITDTSEVHYVCNINDIDNFLELNNGRVLTLFDLGRNDFAIRTGLGKQLIKNRWGLVVAGSTIQYRKRVRLLDKITIKTRLVAVDERWFYIEQVMMAKGKTTSQVLLRTGVTNIKTGRTIPTKQALDALGITDFSLPPTGWVKAWIEADKLREFPD
ncbi:thioeseterase [Moraxella caviae]|uniref:Thioeseterase n=1 Tax=Moraxella caviae TaxID=34060 RepID=A0A1S9ZX01_9GAMM|nr:thioesterase family protein [Moraxella caviae]OOR87978.1 thioeseterase [Moraxella caviae]STZ09717.1 Thioesterase superfamily [Moraxella caviae]